MTDPVVRREFRGAFHLLVVATLGLFLALATLGLAGWLYTRDQAADAKRRANENRAALRYICATTSVLDQLVIDAGSQIQANLDNGVYDKLVARGILKPENVNKARATRNRYMAAHLKLQAHGPCLKIK